MRLAGSPTNQRGSRPAVGARPDTSSAAPAQRSPLVFLPGPRRRARRADRARPAPATGLERAASRGGPRSATRGCRGRCRRSARPRARLARRRAACRRRHGVPRARAHPPVRGRPLRVGADTARGCVGARARSGRAWAAGCAPARAEALAALEVAVLQALRRPPPARPSWARPRRPCSRSPRALRREQLPPRPGDVALSGDRGRGRGVVAGVGARARARRGLGARRDRGRAGCRRAGRHCGTPRARLLWPFNAYVHVPVFERARGGSVLTGFGGDEAFAPSDGTGSPTSPPHVRPGGRDLRRLALALAPRSLRRAALRRRCPLRLLWLSAAGRAALAEAWAAEAAGEPRSSSDRGLWRLRPWAPRTATASPALAAARDVVIATRSSIPSPLPPSRASRSRRSRTGTAAPRDPRRAPAGGGLRAEEGQLQRGVPGPATPATSPPGGAGRASSGGAWSCRPPCAAWAADA